MLVYLSTTLNTGHAFGLARETIILPVLARDEEPQATTQESMFNYVRLSDGGPARHVGPKSEVEVIATLADGVLGTAPEGRETLNGNTQPRAGWHSPIDWRSMQDTGKIRDAIAAIVPGFEQIGDIDKTKEEFQIPGRTFRRTEFATTNGRANIHLHDLPELQGLGPDELRVMTIRSEGQFNTVVYEDYDLYRGVERRDVVIIHPDDIHRLKLDPTKPVVVHGPAGSLRGLRLHLFEEIRPGNAAMYYPEANVLVSRELDPKSKTPAFKCVVVTIEVDQPAPNLTPISLPKAAMLSGAH